MTAPHIGLLEFGELSLGAVIDAAQLADELGFARFWLAEHLGQIENSLLVTTLVAGSTSRIRVGPAGVLLRYHGAVAVGRDGVFLERVFGGRIDLGLAGGRIPAPLDVPFFDGRADVYDPATFEEKLRVVADTVAQHEPADERPEVWVLGASESTQRGQSAARLHAHFCLSLIHTPVPPSSVAIRAYRDEEERLGLAPGHASIAFQLACIESEGERDAHPSPHAAMPGKPFIDTPARCRERIEELCHAYDVSEVAILECSDDAERRLASIRMLAEAFGELPGPPAKGRVPARVTPAVR